MVELIGGVIRDTVRENWGGEGGQVQEIKREVYKEERERRTKRQRPGFGEAGSAGWGE
jgi:hypothetical protein